MNQDCLISVCIPVYNQEEYIADAIKSVLNQTYQNIEIIISDNCSTDTTAQIIEGFSDSRIKCYRQTSNLGMVGNFNFVTEKASGQYIKYLCGDDVLLPTCIEDLYVGIANNPCVAFAACKRTITNNKYNYQDRVSGFFPKKEAIEKIIVDGNFIGEPSVVLVRSDYARQTKFDSFYKQILDLDFYLGLLRFGDLVIIDKVLSVYRVHDQQATYTNTKNTQLMEQEYYHLMLKNVSIYQSNSLLLSRYIIIAIKKKAYAKAVLQMVRHPMVIFCLFKALFRKIFP